MRHVNNDVKEDSPTHTVTDLTSTHLFEVRGRLDLPNGLHERVPDDDADVGSGVAVGFARELPQVGLAQAVWRVAQMEAEHLSPSWLLGKRDIDALLKSVTCQRTSYVSYKV